MALELKPAREWDRSGKSLLHLLQKPESKLGSEAKVNIYGRNRKNNFVGKGKYRHNREEYSETRNICEETITWAPSSISRFWDLFIVFLQAVRYQ